MTVFWSCGWSFGARGNCSELRRGFSNEAGRKCSAGRRIGSGRPPAQHKSIAGGSPFPAPAAIVPSQEPESRDAGVSRFGGNGSHLAEVDTAEGHAGQVERSGMSGKCRNRITPGSDGCRRRPCRMGGRSRWQRKCRNRLTPGSKGCRREPRRAGGRSRWQRIHQKRLTPGSGGLQR